MRRDWRAAVAHHEGKGRRVCLAWPRELAHDVPRQFDSLDDDGRRRRVGTVAVHPHAVVPLCRYHHGLYDSHQLNLEPHLKSDEIEHAVSILGEGEAFRRVRGLAWTNGG